MLGTVSAALRRIPLGFLQCHFQNARSSEPGKVQLCILKTRFDVRSGDTPDGGIMIPQLTVGLQFRIG